MKEQLRLNKEKLKLNNQLPYLVANIIEILDPEVAASGDSEEESGAHLDLDATRTGPTAVIKTSTRQTIYLPVLGLVPASSLAPGDLVGVNRDSYLILDTLPPDYDPRAKAMELEDQTRNPLKEKYEDLGGLEKQTRELVEAVVWPMTKKEKYKTIGVTPPKGVLMYGPPGTGKTMLAKACAAQCGCSFLKLAGPQLVQMYIGDGAKIIRDAFALARKKAPAIVFIDELDAIGTRRGEGDKHGEREVQRTMLELLSQLDGFASSDEVKVIAATNRIDVLDPALLRSGRLDRKVEFPMPDEPAREQILRIHARRMNTHPDVNFEELARSTEDMNGAQLKAVCVESGMLALRREGVTIHHEDFIEGIGAVYSRKKSDLNYYA